MTIPLVLVKLCGINGLHNQNYLIAKMNGRYPNFDILRLLLALEVVAAHAIDILKLGNSWPGFILAVPAFLAISGFLVLKSYSDSGSLLVFARNRSLRILPALIASLLLCLLLLGWQTFYNSLLTWVTGGIYEPIQETNKPLWSLAWEELAYLALAALWACGAYRNPKWIWALFLVSCTIVWITISQNASPFVQVISFLAPSFFVGNLAYIHRDILFRFGGVIPLLLLLVVSAWQYIPHPRIGTTAFIALQAFAVVWAGMAGSRMVPFKFPDLSYGIYIYHMPLLLFISGPCGITDPIEICAALGATLIPACMLSWYLIEKPALSLKAKLFRGSRAGSIDPDRDFARSNC